MVPKLRSRPRGEQYLVRWAFTQLYDIDALSRMVDPSLKGAYPSKSLSRVADIISLCIQVTLSLFSEHITQKINHFFLGLRLHELETRENSLWTRRSWKCTQRCLAKPPFNILMQFLYCIYIAPRLSSSGLWKWYSYIFFFFVWQPEPEFRPPMSEIVQKLISIIQRNPNLWVWVEGIKMSELLLAALLNSVIFNCMLLLLLHFGSFLVWWVRYIQISLFLFFFKLVVLILLSYFFYCVMHFFFCN